MKKKIKKYISGCIVASLLLTAMTFQIVPGAEADSKSRKEQEISINGNESAESTPGVIDDDAIAESLSESSSTVDDLGADVLTGKYRATESADQSNDPEDISGAFTDPAFESAIRNTLGLSEDDSITKSACAGIESLDLSGLTIKSLKGIENCTNLKQLDCSDNSLTNLDISSCTGLTSLSCYGNQLTNLDISKCTGLTSLYCGKNQLTSLDVSKCTGLTSLSCYGNQLTSLDISNCTSLTSLFCEEDQLTNLDISSCTDLTSLYCGGNQLTSLDVSSCAGLTSLGCGSNQLTNLDISSCTDLTSLYCGSNQLTNLDISSCTGLISLDCGYNQLTNLDISSCTNLTSLYCGNNRLTSLDVSSCTKLTELHCGGNQLTSLDISSCTGLTSLGCAVNQLTNLDVSNCTELTSLECHRNELTRLNVSKCTELTYLDCRNNQLTNLDINSCIGLTSLRCAANQLTNLDVSNCTGLTRLDCGSNQLASLDISNCTSLTRLDCGSNQLTSLDISKCDFFNDINSILNCSYNNMKTPDDVKGSTKEVDGKTFIFYPQKNGIDVPTTPTVTPTTTPTASPTQQPTIRPTDSPTQTPAPPQKTKKAQRLTVKPSPAILYIGVASASKTLRVSGARGKVTYKSSNANVVKANAKGNLTPISTGKATITIKAAGNKSYKAATVSVKITVSDKKVKDAYKRYVKKYLSSKKEFPSGRYEVHNINGDSIPEMFFSYSSGGRSTYKIYTYKKGKIIKLGDLSGCTDISYNKKKGQVCVQSSNSSAENILTCYEIGTKKLRQVCRYRRVSENINGKTRQRYYKDDKKIAKRTYKKFTDVIGRWPIL